jgi:phospholipid/cholesterol/gamma-HCH transport system substrate-binding protein
MTSRSQKVRLGVFLLVSGLIAVSAIVTLAGMRLWNPRERYVIRYTESISGLELGSAVKMQGVRVGQVEHIKIDGDTRHVMVSLALTPGTPVTKDTKAVLKSMGITGMQFVELTPGGPHSPRLPPNRPDSLIEPGPSMLETLTGQATVIGVKSEAVLNNLLQMTNEANRARFERLMDNLDKLAVTWEQLSRDNGPKVGRILANLDEISSSLKQTSALVAAMADENRGGLKQTIVAAGQASLALKKAAEDLRPEPALSAITGAADSVRKRVDDPSLARTIKSLGDVAVGLARVVDDLKASIHARDQQMAAILRNLERASADLKQFARTIQDRPSVLIRGDSVEKRGVP